MTALDLSGNWLRPNRSPARCLRKRHTNVQRVQLTPPLPPPPPPPPTNNSGNKKRHLVPSTSTQEQILPDRICFLFVDSEKSGWQKNMWTLHCQVSDKPAILRTCRGSSGYEMCSRDASYITGTELAVDGGFLALGPEALGDESSSTHWLKIACLKHLVISVWSGYACLAH